MARHPTRHDSSGPGQPHVSWTELHDHAVVGNRTALETIAEHALSTLHRQLRRAFPRTDDDLLQDAVTDAFMDYVRRPDHFDSSSSEGLDQFLYRAAWRNAANSLQSDLRRRSREVRYAREARLQALLNQDERSLAIDTTMIRRLLDDTIDVAECEALACWLDGERRTGPLAQALGLGLLPAVDQQREVKRFKDRILKRISRLLRPQPASKMSLAAPMQERNRAHLRSNSEVLRGHTR